MAKKTEKSDKTKFYLGASVLGLLLLGLILFSIGSMGQEDDSEAWGAFSVALIVLLLAIIYMKRQYRSLKEGYPLEDERSKDVKLRAESFGFKFGLYWLIALMWYNVFADELQTRLLDGGDVVALAVVGMGAAFVLSWWWYNKKG